jgi:malonate decarboxylase beta subunit
MSDWNTQQGQNFVELSARERAKQLLDANSFTEFLGPFDRLTSPWLEKQGVVPQFDDGVVIGRGAFNGQPVVVGAIEGSFQGGSLGEVGGAKLAGLLELAIEANQAGESLPAILIFETGGVRLQEANLGLASIAEIQSAIMELRQYQPVIGIVTGPVGCFGGMSISAGLCSYLVMTREGRLGLNGPQVIEQEAGVREYNASDRGMIWSFSGGIQRAESHLVDALVDERLGSLQEVVGSFLEQGVPNTHRSERYLGCESQLTAIDTANEITPTLAKAALQGGLTS